jgi:hypothetical protein
MARQNKKLQKTEGSGLPMIVTGAILVAAVGLVHVWLGCRCEMMGRDIRKLEIERDGLTKQALNEEYHWARTKAPRNLESALSEHRLDMSVARSEQVVRMGSERLTSAPKTRWVASSGGRSSRKAF